MNVELLQRVKAQILAEPNRFDMSSWMLDENDNDIYTTQLFQECGSTACIAGWLVLLGSDRVVRGEEMADVAAELLGVDVRVAETLFYHYEWEEKLKERYEFALNVTESKTDRAKIAAEAIDDFILLNS